MNVVFVEFTDKDGINYVFPTTFIIGMTRDTKKKKYSVFVPSSPTTVRTIELTPIQYNRLKDALVY